MPEQSAHGSTPENVAGKMNHAMLAADCGAASRFARCLQPNASASRSTTIAGDRDDRIYLRLTIYVSLHAFEFRVYLRLLIQTLQQAASCLIVRRHCRQLLRPGDGSLAITRGLTILGQCHQNIALGRVP